MQLFKRRRSLSLLIVSIIFILVIGSGRMMIARAATSFPEGARIGGVDVGGKTADEAMTYLVNKVEDWKSYGKLTIITDQTSIEIPYEILRFDIKGSVEQLEQVTKKPWYAFFKKSAPQQIPIKVSVDENWLVDNLGLDIDLELAIQLIVDTASYLGEHTIDLRPFIASEMETVAELTWTAPDDHIFLDSFVQELDGREIVPNSHISFLEDVVTGVSHYSHKEGNFISSMLYCLALQTPLQIIERHSQRVVPPYTEAGLEAYIHKDRGKDLIIANPTHNTYQIEALKRGNKVTLAFKAMKHPFSYEYQVKKSEDIPFRTIVRYDKDLLPDHEQVIQEGKNGKRVEVYKIERAADGTVSNEEFISRDFYLPVPKIVVKGIPDTEEVTEKVVAEESDTDSREERTIETIKDVLTTRNDGAEETPGELEDKLTDEEIEALMWLLSLLSKLEDVEVPDLVDYLKNELDESSIDNEVDSDSIYENPDIFK